VPEPPIEEAGICPVCQGPSEPGGCDVQGCPTWPWIDEDEDEDEF
jgi:hypothetical protein